MSYYVSLLRHSESDSLLLAVINFLISAELKRLPSLVEDTSCLFIVSAFLVTFTLAWLPPLIFDLRELSSLIRDFKLSKRMVSCTTRSNCTAQESSALSSLSSPRKQGHPMTSHLCTPPQTCHPGLINLFMWQSSTPGVWRA